MLIVTIALSTILQVTKLPFGVFFIVLAFCDVLTLNFFFLVSDFGSWMEIGNSISRFALGNGMIIVILLLFSIAMCLTRGIRKPAASKKKQL